MRQARSLGFDHLEARKLLSTARHAVAHPAHAAALTPIVLNGTLTVDNKAATTTMNPDESTTNVTPVSGVLSGVGAVKGVWNYTYDMYGDYEGPDTIQLHNASGKIVIEFSDANRGTPHKTATGAEFVGLPQVLEGGSGTFARTTEAGTVDLGTNRATTVVQSITVNTGAK